MLTKVWLGGVSIKLADLATLGQGGEADVYDLGDGRALKIYKTIDHPDVVGVPALENAVLHRLAEAPAKLRAFPHGLPAHVVKPLELATRTRKPDDVVGYAMAKVDGAPLADLGEPHRRRAVHTPADDVVAILRDLHVTIDAIHKAGVVIGDFNDHNVLVAGTRAWLIDADSWQYGTWRATMFSERFVDPRLCAPDALVLARPHDPDSDWFAFATMLVRALLWMGPYGGVHAKTPTSRRALERVSIFDRDVVTPKAAVPWRVLPDELIEHLRAIFEDDRRGRFPAALLDRLRFRRCACGAEHARAACPLCKTAVAMPAAIVRGRVRASRLDPASLPRAECPVWLEGAMLMHRTSYGPEVIGQVLAGATRVWSGARLGVGLWRAGGYTQWILFRPGHRGIRDGLAMPRIRGAIVDVHVVCGVDRAWAWWREALAGRETLHCVAIAADGAILGATEQLADDPGWLAGVPGACAIGAALFVPTDAGIVRIEPQLGALAPVRTFPDTADFVTTADQLFPGPAGLDVRTRDGALRLTLS